MASLVALTMIGPPAPAACAAPTVSLSRAEVETDQKVIVTGRYWFSGCQDGGSCGACGACDYGPEEKPLRNISLFLRPQKRSTTRQEWIRLADVDANYKFTFTQTFNMPAVRPGRYVVVAVTPHGLSQRSGRTLVVRD